MDKKPTEEFYEDLEDFDTAMLVTRDADMLRSRPMKPYVGNPDGSIRFLTSKHTHKIDEANADPAANVVFADDGEWISVSGDIMLSSDPSDIDELWTADAEPWFENGKADAVVMILNPRAAEYWDSSKLKANWEMLKSAVTGQKADPGTNQKLAL